MHYPSTLFLSPSLRRCFEPTRFFTDFGEFVHRAPDPPAVGASRFTACSKQRSVDLPREKMDSWSAFRLAVAACSLDVPPGPRLHGNV